MFDDETRVVQARWLLERMHASIAAIDAIVAVSVGLNTGMLAGLAAACAVSRAGGVPSWWTLGAVAVAVLALVISNFCSAMAVIPRTKGTTQSVIYFSAIALQNQADFAARFASVDDAALLSDLSVQIHRNAEIATSKNWWIRQGTFWSFGATLPWMISLAMLVARQVRASRRRRPR